MKGLTLTMKEQTRLCIMNAVLERQWSIAEAAPLLGVSERHTWRLLAAYRKEDAAALAHRNRNRLPPNATPVAVQTQVIALARDRYQGVNHTHFTELLAEREGISLSRSTVRRLLVRAGGGGMMLHFNTFYLLREEAFKFWENAFTDIFLYCTESFNAGTIADDAASQNEIIRHLRGRWWEILIHHRNGDFYCILV